MTSLYRPGPMESIGSFIARRHGKEVITYPHPMLEDILGVTYGIIVYQEQVMRIAQKMGPRFHTLRRRQNREYEKQPATVRIHSAQSACEPNRRRSMRGWEGLQRMAPIRDRRNWKPRSKRTQRIGTEV